MKEDTFLSVFEGVPTFDVARELFENGINAVELCSERAVIFPSKGEMRRLIKGGGISINNVKLTDDNHIVDKGHLLNDKYLLVQKGKKNYFIVRAL